MDMFDVLNPAMFFCIMRCKERREYEEERENY